tara:strand:+ start:301 stop:1161 length:861 start_codon:yes stop_codon:yes gene_type:complete
VQTNEGDEVVENEEKIEEVEEFEPLTQAIPSSSSPDRTMRKSKRIRGLQPGESSPWKKQVETRKPRELRNKSVKRRLIEDVEEGEEEEEEGQSDTSKENPSSTSFFSAIAGWVAASTSLWSSQSSQEERTDEQEEGEEGKSKRSEKSKKRKRIEDEKENGEEEEEDRPPEDIVFEVRLSSINDDADLDALWLLQSPSVHNLRLATARIEPDIAVATPIKVWHNAFPDWSPLENDFYDYLFSKEALVEYDGDALNAQKFVFVAHLYRYSPNLVEVVLTTAFATTADQ